MRLRRREPEGASECGEKVQRRTRQIGKKNALRSMLRGESVENSEGAKSEIIGTRKPIRRQAGPLPG